MLQDDFARESLLLYLSELKRGELWIEAESSFHEHAMQGSR
jgi:hypothetical protein